MLRDIMHFHAIVRSRMQNAFLSFLASESFLFPHRIFADEARKQPTSGSHFSFSSSHSRIRSSDRRRLLADVGKPVFWFLRWSEMNPIFVAIFAAINWEHFSLDLGGITDWYRILMILYGFILYFFVIFICLIINTCNFILNWTLKLTE